jgi:hypothetical protein
MTQQGRNMKECVTIDEKTLCAFVGDFFLFFEYVKCFSVDISFDFKKGAHYFSSFISWAAA